MNRFLVAITITALAACGTPESDPDNAANAGTNNSTNPNGQAGNNGSTTGNNGSTAGNNGSTTGNNGSTNNSDTENNHSTNTGDLTWHKDARPIVEANCAGCHYEGGIGPFALTTYEETAPLAAVIQSAVASDVMPPWPPADNCGDFKHERKLDQTDKDTLLGWIAAGTPEGDPADYVAPQAEEGEQLGTPDYVVDIGFDYTPTPPDGGIDDYHCFIIEPGFDEDKFMNAFQVRSGNKAAVHHLLFWQIDNEELDSARAKETTPGEGYTCFGGNGLGSETGLAGGWVPGALPVKFGEGQGIRLPSDSFLVVQIHYNTVNGDDPDRTEIDLWFTDGPADTPLGMYPLPDTSLSVDAGDANGHAGTSFTMPIGATVYGVVPHMHMLGTRIKVAAGDQCLVDIPDWDFNWQGFYLYETPVDVSAGSELSLDCWYDNSAQNQPNGRTPQDVTWGEGTYDEMCLNYFIIEEIPFL